jgi:hypothetical protein
VTRAGSQSRRTGAPHPTQNGRMVIQHDGIG